MRHLWVGLAGVIAAVAVWQAATSPLLVWRSVIYVLAGFAGVLGLVVMLAQPLLAARDVPGLTGPRAVRVHRMMGAVLVALVLVHVGGLWLTSPPDVVDALLFRSPTPFSVWGVIAMWVLFVVAALVALRRRLGLRPAVWRRVHGGLVAVAVIGTIVHALQIEGTMETASKAALCLCVAIALGWAVWKRRTFG